MPSSNLIEKSIVADSLEKPFIRCFKTIHENYIYDIGTNRIFKVDEVIFGVINEVGLISEDEILSQYSSAYGREAVIRALDEIREAQQRGIFKGGNPSKMSLGFGEDILKKKLDTELGQMILEVVQECNLNCNYCSSGGYYKGRRTVRESKMPVEVMMKAVDLLYEHSCGKEEVTLSFYGGEPLLNFPMIKKAVEYAGKKFGKRKCTFSMTTNATRIGPEEAGFFCDNDFSITVSIDGPRDIHNAHRLDKNKHGSYDNAIRGLKYLIEEYGDRAQTLLSLSMVITPPYDLERVNALWDEEPWLPRDISVMASYVDGKGTSFFEDHPVSPEYKQKSKEIEVGFLRDYFSDFIKMADTKKRIGKAMYEIEMAKFIKRPLFDEPEEGCYLNGCCVPGVRKVFVGTNGKINLCERVYGTPVLGNVDDGYDYKAILEMLSQYQKGCEEECFSCWAVRLCGLCYMHAFSRGVYDKELKTEECETQRSTLNMQMRLFTYALEKNQHCMDALKDYSLE